MSNWTKLTRSPIVAVDEMKKKVFLLLILTTLIISIIPSPAYACSCAQPPPPLESLEASDAVFLGKVTNSERIPRGHEEFVGDDDVMVTFEVSKVWKGPASQTLVVVTGLGGGYCGLGYFFVIGEEYLVYALGEGSELSTYLCTRTTQISNAQEDLAKLNRLGGRPLGDPNSTPQFDFGSILPNYYYVILGAVAVVIAVILISRRSGR